MIKQHKLLINLKKKRDKQVRSQVLFSRVLVYFSKRKLMSLLLGLISFELSPNLFQGISEGL